MKKGDTWYLKDPRDRIIGKFVLDNDPNGSMTGKAYMVVAWVADTHEPTDYEFFVEVYCKIAACTHWWFRGQDGTDSYYHICGTIDFKNHLAMHCFIWKLGQTMASTSEETKEYYSECGVGELVDYILKDYTIIQEEPTDGDNTEA